MFSVLAFLVVQISRLRAQANVLMFGVSALCIPHFTLNYTVILMCSYLIKSEATTSTRERRMFYVLAFLFVQISCLRAQANVLMIGVSSLCISLSV